MAGLAARPAALEAAPLGARGLRLLGGAGAADRGGWGRGRGVSSPPGVTQPPLMGGSRRRACSRCGTRCIPARTRTAPSGRAARWARLAQTPGCRGAGGGSGGGAVLAGQACDADVERQNAAAAAGQQQQLTSCICPRSGSAAGAGERGGHRESAGQQCSTAMLQHQVPARPASRPPLARLPAPPPGMHTHALKLGRGAHVGLEGAGGGGDVVEEGVAHKHAGACRTRGDRRTRVGRAPVGDQ